jgi:Zn-dependent peptidase ImmA (M78 family)
VLAAELLMPEPAVQAIWENNPSVSAAAEVLAVSGEAMDWRLFNLRLVETQTAQS